MRDHGTRTRYVSGCRCEECRAANRAYARQRERYGWEQQVAARWVSPERAVAHLEWLRARGVGLRLVSQQTGIARTTLSKLGQRARISATTETRILRVPATPSVVDGLGTRRRLQALVAIGWPMSQLATRLGWSRANLGALMRDGRRVSRHTASAVEGLYEQLWDQPGPSARARNLAAQRRWVPPMAWDDIDHDETPAMVAGARDSRRTPQDWLEDFEDTRDHHQGDLHLAAIRLSVDRKTLEQGLHRARRLGVAS